MKKSIIILLLFISTFSFAQSENAIVIGHSQEIQSKVLNEKRKINIYLPEGYNPNDTTKYPVVYIIDGGVEEDFFHITGIIRFNTQPWINRLPKSIVVGIENTDRRRDCSFAVDNLDFLKKMGFKKEQLPSYGGSANYIKFIATELQPYINSSYKTNHHKTVIGESFAGLLATEILLKHRDLFDTYIIMSPSLWWGNELLLKEAPALLAAKNKTKVKVYIGACNKDENIIMHEDAIALRDVLKKYGGAETTAFYDYLPDEVHATMMHQSVYNAFKMLYPKK
ncbi:alpha/beta hydrolase [Chitinophaga flava]|uniref:Esterase n=1 Tax=Chitinophaga flava TaxID=2259036 RepID=A0A365XUJ5_9BACT|nr:alpha/beta hydrolase-fold protein [Chitinophaga flava]RBL89374.1 esterase [Chitinophaga flava]